jgi:steroid delta-isomerase-like uncharacterized protein
MDTERNKALIRKWIEALNTRQLDVAQEVFAAAHRDGYAGPGQTIGPAGVQERVGRLLSAFPDLQFVIEDMVAEGDRVVTRFSVRGTHRGEFMGRAPTGRQFEIGWVSFVQIAAGQVAASWGLFDGLALLRQLDPH